MEGDDRRLSPFTAENGSVIQRLFKHTPDGGRPMNFVGRVGRKSARTS